MSESKKPARLMSLDAVRGFDMLFIMGGEGLICAIAALFGHPEFEKSFGHVAWHGLQFMDTVFPTFLFLAGVSFPFSVASSRAKGLSTGAIASRALKRGLILFLLGILYGGFICDLRPEALAKFRIFSVLGRIGLAWMFAAWIYLAVKNLWGRLAIATGILAGVTLFTRFVLSPDAPAGADPFSIAGNFGCWLDRVVCGAHIYRPGEYDPEGFAGLLPAVVTAMLGMFAGDLVRSKGGEATGRKALMLLGAGVLSALLGWGLSFAFPVNKALWSPSFVLVVGGYSFALFALFYWLVDVLKKRRWAFFFMVIGLNSITIYLAQCFISFRHTANWLFMGTAVLLPKLWTEVFMAGAYIAVCWLFLYFLYRKNTFLKV